LPSFSLKRHFPPTSTTPHIHLILTMGNSPRKANKARKPPVIGDHLREGALEKDYEDFESHEIEKNLLKSRDDITKIYLFKETIGKGYFGIVKKALLLRELDHPVAIKIVEMQRKRDVFICAREGGLLRKVDHPYIINLSEVYQDATNTYYVTPICEGGSIYDKLQKEKKFDEKTSAAIMIKAIKAVKYLHKIGILHRDVKTENFLYTNSEEGESEIKLIDFGLARSFPFKTAQHSVGTPHTMAPEVL